MSLNGNLEVFPLEEVLRLLARSRKTGCLRVESGGVQGRIFLNGGALALATVVGDDELRRRLLTSGLVTEADLRKVELSGSPVSESLAPEATATALSEFVREESVEGLYRIRRTGRGSFDFLIDMTPRYPTGQSYDSEVIVSEADRRALEWEDVEAVLPSMDSTLRMVPVLDGEDAVTLSPSTWRILAALGSGASVSAVAGVVGWSDFRSAREIASLYRNGLLTIVEPQGLGRTSSASTTELPVIDEPALDSYAEAPEPHDAEVPEAEHQIAEVPENPEVPAAAPTGDDTGVSESGTWSGEAPESSDAAPVWSLPADQPVTPADVGFENLADAAEPTVLDVDDSGDRSIESDDWASEASPDEVVGATGGESSEWWADSAASPVVEPAPEATEIQDTPWSNSPWSAEIPTAETPADEPAVQSIPWGGWMTTPQVREDAEPLEVVDAVDESVDAGESEAEPDRTGGWWAETMGSATESAGQPTTDNDADRFLESVFSSLSDEKEAGPTKSEEEDDESGFGMGLLRRRRMGAAARDISDNNNR